MRASYATFGEAAQALGINVKEPTVKSEKARKCRKCGGDLRHVPGTNVYVCDGTIVREDVTPGGVKCDVVEPCGNVVIARA